MTWAGHETRARDMTNASKSQSESLKGWLRWRIILKVDLREICCCFEHIVTCKDSNRRASKEENSPSLYDARAKYAKRLFQVILT
jgi:hypothetical protein